MLRYKLTPSLNDGKNDPPAREVQVLDGTELGYVADAVFEELANDEGRPFGVGFTLKIERTL